MIEIEVARSTEATGLLYGPLKKGVDGVVTTAEVGVGEGESELFVLYHTHFASE